MKKLQIFKIFILILVLSFPGSILKSQDFKKANSLFNNKAYRYASLEYIRISYATKDINVKANAEYCRAICLRLLGENKQALLSLSQINLFFLKNEIRIKIIYEKMLNFLILKDYSNIEMLISKSKFYFKNKEEYKILLPWYILALNSQSKFKKAQEELKYLIQTSDIEESKKKLLYKELNNIYSKKYPIRLKSPKTAKLLSTFIPGSGSIYNGDVFRGIMTFGVCTSSLYFGIYEMYYKYYFTGYFVGINIFAKSYFKGQSSIEKRVEIKNEKRINAFNYKCISIMEKIKKNKPTIEK